MCTVPLVERLRDDAQVPSNPPEDPSVNVRGLGYFDEPQSITETTDGTPRSAPLRSLNDAIARAHGEPFVAVDKIDVLPHGLSQAVFEQLEREIEAKEYSFNDGVLFMMLEFEDVCKIEVYTSRK